MKRTGVALVLGMVAVVVLLVQYRAGGAPETAERPLKIGLVNVIKVLTECQENTEFRQAAKKKNQKYKAQREQLMQEADALQQELENALEPGSEEYKTQLQKWFDKRALLKAYEEGQKQVLTVESQAFMEALYKKLLAEVNSLARREGYDLILDYEAEELQTRSLAELEQMVRMRKVLYGSAALDLTGRIIENLDRKYEAEKASAGK